MKRATYWIAILAASLGVMHHCLAGLPVTEPFIPDPGNDNLLGHTTPAGLTWVPAGSGALQPTIQSGNLIVPGLAVPSGGHAQVVAGIGTSARLPFGGAQTSGAVLCSFALKVADAAGLGSGGDFVVALTPSGAAQGNTPTNGFCRIFLRSNGGGYQIGFTKSSSVSEDVLWHPAKFTSEDIVFLVTSYVFAMDGSSKDAAYFWVNPSPSDLGAPSAPPPMLVSTNGPDANQLASLVLFQKPAPVMPAELHVDELRLAATWAEVTPAANDGPVDVKVELLGLYPEAEIQGEPVNYSVRISNAGPNIATGVSVVVAHQDLPVTGITASSAAGDCQVVGNEVRCAVNQLAPGEAGTLGISVTPQSSGKLLITASATSFPPELRQIDNLADFRIPIFPNVEECACSCFSNAIPTPDPMLSSWFTKYSGQYARMIPATGASSRTRWEAGPPATTMNLADDIVINRYADIQKIQSDSKFVYVTAYGLASYEMGPWYCSSTDLFPNWPDDQTRPFKFPRELDVAACADTGLDAIGLWVNGTAIYNMLDGYYYDPTSEDPAAESDARSADIHPGPLGGVWHRDAWFSEEQTFDPAKFHSSGTGQYHSHANPLYLRLQLGDNLYIIRTVSGEIVKVSEFGTPSRHSPILGWAFDGHPVYGPYGYSDPMDAASGIRRMRSGYVQRDGSNGTTDLTTTGRTTLPVWARLVQGRTTSALDPTTEYGPPTSRGDDLTHCNTIPFDLGRYAEDNAYLGHLINPDDGDWFHQGEDFDLDLHNGRCCVTPEYPEGTYAYFVTIDTNGVPVFPYVLGWQYCGTPNGGENATIPNDGVSTYYSAQRPKLNSIQLTNHLVKLQWTSREGGTYRVKASQDLQNWSTLGSSIPSGGTNSDYAIDPGNPPPVRQFYKIELQKDGGDSNTANP